VRTANPICGVRGGVIRRPVTSNHQGLPLTSPGKANFLFVSPNFTGAQALARNTIVF
jgi:hypothetical protein